MARPRRNAGNPPSGNASGQPPSTDGYVYADPSVGGILDPSTVAADDTGGGSNSGDGTGGGTSGTEQPKRRGRPPGSGKSKAIPLNISGIEGLLCGLHLGLASFLDYPGMALEPAEAHNLAEALANVQRHYPQLNMAAKTIDHINLVIALGGVYGSRIRGYKNRKKGGDNVVPLSPVPRAEPPTPPAFVAPVIDVPPPSPPGNGGAAAASALDGSDLPPPLREAMKAMEGTDINGISFAHDFDASDPRIASAIRDRVTNAAE